MLVRDFRGGNVYVYVMKVKRFYQPINRIVADIITMETLTIYPANENLYDSRN